MLRALMRISMLAFLLALALPLPLPLSAATFTRFLALGMSGTDVVQLQQFLKDGGYYTYPEITGYFGPVTEAAVSRYQASTGLPSVGRVGPLTLAKLNSGPAPSSSDRELALGMSGTDVVQLQQFLKDGGYYTYPEITGYFGPVTEAAVRAYQAARGAAPVLHTRISLSELAPPPSDGGNGSTDTAEEPTAPAPARKPSSGHRTGDDRVPEFLSRSESGIGKTSVTIAWTTDENSDSEVEYGPTTAYGLSSGRDTSLSTSHSVSLSDLTANTTYHYRIRSADLTGNVGYSSDDTFTTAMNVPSGFAWTPDFNIFNTAGVYSTDFDIDAYRPAYTRTIYVGSGGSNLNDGLSHANRARSISAGITKANTYTGETVRLLIDPGEYRLSAVSDGFSDSWNGVSPTVNMLIEASGTGDVISIQDIIPTSVATTTDPNIYKITYATGVNRSVIDRTYTDNGQPLQAYQITSVASTTNPIPEINAAWATYGSAVYKQGGTTLWVRLSDNRQPDSNVIGFRSTTNGAFTSTNASRTLWMSGLTFWGGQTFVATGGTTGGGFNPKLYAKDVVYAFSGNGNTSGFSWGTSDGESYHVESSAFGNFSDGFNYRGAVKAFELRTIANDNGYNTGTNNGSTAHTSVRIIRMNALYEGNENRVVHDINDVHSWNIGVTSGPSRTTSGETSANFAAGSAGATTQTTKMWLDGVTSVDGSAYDLQAYDNTFIYVANTNTSAFTNLATGTPVGTITTYTP